MKKRNDTTALCNKLWTGDIVNLVVGVMLSFLCMDASPNAIYSARSVAYHLVNAAAAQTTVNQVSQSGSKAATEGTIRYRLRDLPPDKFQDAANQMLKSKAIKTLPRRRLTFAIDFVLLPFYGKEKSEGRNRVLAQRGRRCRI